MRHLRSFFVVFAPPRTSAEQTIHEWKPRGPLNLKGFLSYLHPLANSIRLAFRERFTRTGRVILIADGEHAL